MLETTPLLHLQDCMELMWWFISSTHPSGPWVIDRYTFYHLGPLKSLKNLRRYHLLEYIYEVKFIRGHPFFWFDNDLRQSAAVGRLRGIGIYLLWVQGWSVAHNNALVLWILYNEFFTYFRVPTIRENQGKSGRILFFWKVREFNLFFKI